MFDCGMHMGYNDEVSFTTCSFRLSQPLYKSDSLRELGMRVY